MKDSDIRIWHKAGYSEEFNGVRSWEIIENQQLFITTKKGRIFGYWLSDLRSWNLPENKHVN